MARSRWRPLVWLTVVLWLAVACSKNPTGGTDGTTDDGPLPGFDAPPPSGLFPLGVSSDRGSLVTAEGKPFLLHGEAAWSLIVQLDTAGAMRYLADRRDRGVNTVLVNLIEHHFSDRPPRNAAGDAPFTTPGDFTTPNEAYFAHADRVIDLVASQGMAILLTPAYLGYAGGDEGWYQEMSAQSATKCQSYGDFLGRRYAGKSNIIWIWGGDYTPPPGNGLTCMAAIRDGIRQGGSTAMASAHWAPESTSRDVAAFAGSIDLVGVYSYQLVLPACRAARAISSPSRMPTYLFETCYEDEPFRRCPPTREVRRQQWWGLLGCGAGEIYGVDGVWQFDDRWSQKLDSPVSLNEQRLFAISQQVAWHTLELDDALVTSGRGATGSAAEVVATRTSDHKQALIYLPPDGASTITVDLNRLSGSVTAVWQDPTAVRSVPAGSNLTGSRALATPGINTGGDKDWVLMLTVP